MILLRDPFFWRSGCKYMLSLVIGFGLATWLLGVPERVSITLAVGAIIGFPVAFALGARRPPSTEGRVPS
jgi:hypothetical protein